MTQALNMPAGTRLRLPNGGPEARVVRWFVQRATHAVPDMPDERVCEVEIRVASGSEILARRAVFSERFLRLAHVLS